jgi:hypothetical protein
MKRSTPPMGRSKCGSGTPTAGIAQVPMPGADTQSFLIHENENYVEAERQAGIEGSLSC